MAQMLTLYLTNIRASIAIFNVKVQKNTLAGAFYRASER